MTDNNIKFKDGMAYTSRSDTAFPVVQRGAPLKKGLTKQEYFAGEALKGILNSFKPETMTVKELAAYCDNAGRLAVLLANGLIRALNEQSVR